MRPRTAIRVLSAVCSHAQSTPSFPWRIGICCIHSNRTMSSAKPRVYVTRRVPNSGPTYLRQFCEVTQWDSEETVPRAELLKGVKGVDALFCLLTDKIDSEDVTVSHLRPFDRYGPAPCGFHKIEMTQGPSLKAVSTMSVGYDHVDIAECKRRGIPVGFTPDVLTNATAELTVALLLATSRRLKEGIRAVKEGEWGTWNPLWLLGQGLEGATVGIIGLGRIGFAVAQRIKPFGVEQILYAEEEEKDYASQIPAKFSSFEELLEKSDFVLGCCALTKENMGLMNKSAFKKMKNTAVFVNTSRGGLVNQDDLYEALKSGQIWGAGLDVTSPEPLPTNHPLLTLDNCVVLPHIASATLKARSAMSELCARNIMEALNGNTMPALVK